MEKILKYIETLKRRSFEGWTADSKYGYLTACISIEEKIRSIQHEETN